MKQASEDGFLNCISPYSITGGIEPAGNSGKMLNEGMLNDLQARFILLEAAMKLQSMSSRQSQRNCCHAVEESSRKECCSNTAWCQCPLLNSAHHIALNPVKIFAWLLEHPIQLHGKADLEANVTVADRPRMVSLRGTCMFSGCSTTFAMEKAMLWTAKLRSRIAALCVMPRCRPAQQVSQAPLNSAILPGTLAS